MQCLIIVQFIVVLYFLVRFIYLHQVKIYTEFKAYLYVFPSGNPVGSGGIINTVLSLQKQSLEKIIIKTKDIIEHLPSKMHNFVTNKRLSKAILDLIEN